MVYYSAEDKLQFEAIKLIRQLGGFCIHVPNESKRSIWARKKFLLMGGMGGVPDILCFDPRHGFSGLALELKAVNIYKKNGEIYKRDHLKRQQEFLHQLRINGWCAEFVVGWDQCKQTIEHYYNVEQKA